jgi:gliding motility-associated-like protein
MRGLVQYMTRLIAKALIPLLLVLASARAETVVYVGTTSTLEVVQYPGDTYVWDLYNDSTVNFATTPGSVPAGSASFVGGNTGPKVDVTWNQTGIYFFRVMARNASNCTNNLKVGRIKVVPIPVDAVISGANLIGACEQITLNASKSIGQITEYKWSTLDPGITLTRTTGIETDVRLSPSYSGTLPAHFRVRLQVTTNSGHADSDTITIKVDPKPIAGITSSLQPEKDGSMLVDGSVSVGTGLTYRWSTNQGKIVGAADQPVAYLLGAGMYTLEVIDIHGCISVKSFRFPIELYDIQARPDYARTSWAEDTTVIVLANDNSTAGLIPGSVHVIKPPSRGEVRVNPDGSVTYTPTGRISGRDEFVYEVCDIVNLCDSALVTIDIYDVGLKVPEAFSPNGDGLNEHLVFTGLEHYPQSHLHVYTRSGQLVYASSDYLNDWDGSWIKSNLSNNGKVPTGVYYYVLELGGVNRTIKGFVYIGY